MAVDKEAISLSRVYSSILLKEPRVFAKFDQFLPVRSHFDNKRPLYFKR